MNWYLRKQDQTVYGPVALAALQDWARGGRVLPDDEVSPDRQVWQRAPALPDLQMEWLIDLGDGERFGPVHVLALAELVREGSVPADVWVQHVSDGRISQLAAVALPAVLAVPPPVPPPAARISRRSGCAHSKGHRGCPRPPRHPIPAAASSPSAWFPEPPVRG